jgi:hypothetical protein
MLVAISILKTQILVSDVTPEHFVLLKIQNVKNMIRVAKVKQESNEELPMAKHKNIINQTNIYHCIITHSIKYISTNLYLYKQMT